MKYLVFLIFMFLNLGLGKTQTTIFPIDLPKNHVDGVFQKSPLSIQFPYFPSDSLCYTGYEINWNEGNNNWSDTIQKIQHIYRKEDGLAFFEELIFAKNNMNQWYATHLNQVYQNVDNLSGFSPAPDSSFSYIWQNDAWLSTKKVSSLKDSVGQLVSRKVFLDDHVIADSLETYRFDDWDHTLTRYRNYWNINTNTYEKLDTIAYFFPNWWGPVVFVYFEYQTDGTTLKKTRYLYSLQDWGPNCHWNNYYLSFDTLSNVITPNGDTIPFSQSGNGMRYLRDSSNRDIEISHYKVAFTQSAFDPNEYGWYTRIHRRYTTYYTQDWLPDSLMYEEWALDSTHFKIYTSMDDYIYGSNGYISEIIKTDKLWGNVPWKNNKKYVFAECLTPISNIPEIVDKGVKVYSFGNGRFDLLWENDASIPKVISVFDTQGIRHRLFESTDSIVTIDLANCPIGVYLVHINQGKTSHVLKLFKQ